MIEYVDISEHQGSINLTGAKMVVARCSIGGSYDDQFTSYMDQCNKKKIPFAAYHFLYHPDSASIAQQVKVASDQCGTTIPLMLDLEKDGSDPQPNISHALAFVDAVRKAGVTCKVLYTPRWFWAANLKGGSLKGFVDRGMILVNSNYSDNADVDGWVSFGGMPVSILQFTGDGIAGPGNHRSLNGRSELDWNRFKGSLNELKTAFGFKTTAPPPVVTPPSSVFKPVVLARFNGVRAQYHSGPSTRRQKTESVAQYLIDFVGRYYPKADELVVTSAHRDFEEDGGTWSHHNGQIYPSPGGSRTAAVDFAGLVAEVGSWNFDVNNRAAIAMRDFAKWLWDNFGDLLVQMLHETPFSDDNGFFVLVPRVKRGGSDKDHRNHVHAASSWALITQMNERAAKLWPNRSK